MMASFVPATTKSKSPFSSSLAGKKACGLPSLRPTLTPATGPSKGTPVSINAALMAIMAIESGRKFGSIESTVATP